MRAERVGKAGFWPEHHNLWDKLHHFWCKKGLLVYRRELKTMILSDLLYLLVPALPWNTLIRRIGTGMAVEILVRVGEVVLPSAYL
jgi:hypothetical protein